MGTRRQAASTSAVSSVAAAAAAAAAANGRQDENAVPMMRGKPVTDQQGPALPAKRAVLGASRRVAPLPTDSSNDGVLADPGKPVVTGIKGSTAARIPLATKRTTAGVNAELSSMAGGKKAGHTIVPEVYQDSPEALIVQTRAVPNTMDIDTEEEDEELEDDDGFRSGSFTTDESTVVSQSSGDEGDGVDNLAGDDAVMDAAHGDGSQTAIARAHQRHQRWHNQGKRKAPSSSGHSNKADLASSQSFLIQQRVAALPKCVGRPHWTEKDLKELRLAAEHYVDPEAEEEEWDISMVSEYSQEIFEYMGELEVRLAPNPSYLAYQAELEGSMRRILIDWLVQVHARFHLLGETLFLTVNIIDRFLSIRHNTALGKFQLLGATALFIASKYEEIQCPSVAEIEFMVDKTYTQEEILACERHIISVLDFDFGWPGPMSFLRRISKADDYDVDTRTLAKYVLEVTIMDEQFIGGYPSYLAAASHFVSRKMLKKGEWTEAHVHLSGFTAAVLEPAVEALLECLRDPQTHHKAIYEKYAERKFKRASKYVEAWFQEHDP